MGNSSARQTHATVYRPDIDSAPQAQGQPQTLEHQLQTEVTALVESIQSRKEEVNLVITGPVCIGTGEFCDFIVRTTRHAFRYVDLDALLTDAEALTNNPAAQEIARSYRRYVSDLEQQRAKAIKNFDKPQQAMVLQTIDLLRENYLRLLERDLMNVGGMPKGSMRVYHRSPIDYLNAFGAAARELGSIDQASYDSLRLIGNQSWKLSTSHCSPSRTIYVYISYPDKVFAEAYDEHVKQYEATASSAAAPDESSSSIDVDGLKRYRAHAIKSKEMFDRLYLNGTHEAVAQYFTVVMDCADRLLLSNVHALAICREIFKFVDSLQSASLWNAPDEVRLDYLTQMQWKIHRCRRIPLQITSERPSPSAVRAFIERSPQIPVHIDKPLVNPRLANVRAEANVSPTPPKKKTTTPPTLRPVYLRGVSTVSQENSDPVK